jgi:hypothetical protein
MNLSLTREWRFLLACAKLQPTDLDREWINQEYRGFDLDWNRVIQYACQHDIAPLVHHTMQRAGLANADSHEAFKKLKALSYGNAIRNTLLYQELETVLLALRNRGKSVLVLKGAALAETVYQKHALRPMSDVDLLIKKEDLAEIEGLLRKLGYVFYDQQRTREWYLDNHYHLVFRKQVSASFTSCLEIHWHLERPILPFPINIEGVWERAVVARVANVEVLVLSPEDLLLHLCLHTCRHKLTGGFRAFCDISETIRQYERDMDWEQVSTRATEWRIETFVYVVLLLTHELLGTRVPERLFDTLRHANFDMELPAAAGAAVLEDRLSAALFADFFHLQRGHGFTDRTQVLRKLFSSTVITERYGLSPGSMKIYWYYLVRLKDLVVQYGPELLRFLGRGGQVLAEADHKSRLADWLAPFATNDIEKNGEGHAEASEGFTEAV